jgi:hypothetical protein
VANGINTVHLAYAREYVGHALIGAPQRIPREQIDIPGPFYGCGSFDHCHPMTGV